MLYNVTMKNNLPEYFVVFRYGGHKIVMSFYDCVEAWRLAERFDGRVYRGKDNVKYPDEDDFFGGE